MIGIINCFKLSCHEDQRGRVDTLPLGIIELEECGNIFVPPRKNSWRNVVNSVVLLNNLMNLLDSPTFNNFDRFNRQI